MTTDTPHAVDQNYINAPVLNIALMSRVPSLDELEAVLQTAFGSRLGQLHRKDGVVLAGELDGQYLVHIAVLDEPPADPNNTYELHPVLTGDPSGLEDVKAQVLISLLPNNSIIEQVRMYREPRVQQLLLHGQVTAAVASLNNVEAIHNTIGNVTESPTVFVEGVTNNDPAMFTASVWLTQSAEGITAYTVGMVCTGHPEIMAEDSQLDPTDLFYRMLDVVNYALRSGTLKDGDTLGFSHDAEPLTISTATYLTDSSIPAVRVSL